MQVVGTHECKLDPKGRVKLPVSLVKQLKGVETFVLKRSVFQKCLELYTLEEWTALMEKVNKLNRFKKKNNDFIRRFTAGIKMIELDAATRILVPKDLLHIASLDKAIVLSSAINMIEIWDKELYEQAIDDATLDFAELAEEVMGNEDDDVS
ncbi:MAG: division/cell wall cluster transcriptional repressor MraZ [Flavobacteriaceae bacterium]|jgi:MraZ protein|nr:division/cell wall cluster transcriptional repressor MraZ [Flavobacteriaceae bacterium]MBT7459031.1 division/cell wall cluster transcriptional repressor MraZ [Flavobacteriaceae bacterium]